MIKAKKENAWKYCSHRYYNDNDDDDLENKEKEEEEEKDYQLSCII